MRSSLITAGVILLVFGAVLYWLPSPRVQTTSTTVDEGAVDTRTTYASMSVSWEVIVFSFVAGGILLILGLVLSSRTDAVAKEPDETSDEKVVETLDHVERSTGAGRKVIHERHEQRVKT